MDIALKGQLRQTVYVAFPTGIDEAGQVTLSAATTFACRVEPRYREMPMYGGIEERTEHIVILAEDFTATEKDTREAYFWLPGASSANIAEGRRAKVVSQCYGENGELDHVEVTV